MKDTIRIVLIFVLSMILLLTLSYVIQHAVGPKPAAETAETEPSAEAAEEAEAEKTVYNEMNEAGAAVITLSGDTASVTGLGARVSGSVVTIAYPGTYRVEGTLTDGQLVVDLGDYSGAAYVILNGASITNSQGPALHVVQADSTTVYLAEGSLNELTDGADYMIETAGELHTGAALYSADDLVIDGAGQLSLNGSSADGLRVKDELTIAGGGLNISCIDDGIQVNDRLTVSDGSILIGANGDGVNVSQGGMELGGGHLWINCAGDAISVLTELDVTGGAVTATAYGGSTMYAEIAMNDLSAKGLKADTITVTGGSIDLDTADDCIHAARNVFISGGSFSLSSGDDAIAADGLLDVRNVTVSIVECYEGFEAGTVTMDNVWVSALASNNGVDAGDGGLSVSSGTLLITAPRILGSAGAMSVRGTVTAVSDGTKSPLSFLSADVTGGIQIYCTAGTAQELLADGELPGSLLFVLPDDLPAGTTVTLYDAAGTVLYTTATTESGGMFLFAGAPLQPGGTYTLLAGETLYPATVGDGCTVTPESALTQSGSGEASGGPSR